MADPIDLSRLLPDARTFLDELAAHNDRAWFKANKTRYDTQLKRPSERLLADIAGWLEKTGTPPPRTKLFRPHRDIRFSQDKTPYHVHLHMMWSLPDGRAWMLGIAPDYATAGAGIMSFSKDQVERFRAACAAPEGAQLVAQLERGWRLDPPDLQRVPPPYPADHPRAAHLRRKGLVVWADDLDKGLAAAPVGTVQAVFARAAPVMDWLADIA
jgi:uncharacterized protein (TIGR02453 family)